MRRTMISGETKRVAAFLAHLLRRNDRSQVELIRALEGTASGRIADLSVFNPWAKQQKGLTYFVALAMLDANNTKPYVLQACNHCTGKKARISPRSKLSELLSQRRDLINTMIW